MNVSVRKSKQLGINFSTAFGKLRKSIMLLLLKELHRNYCFHCGLEIVNERELSIEHKIPWLDSNDPTELFFNLDNIAFSHLSCNVSRARRKAKIKEANDTRVIHGTLNTYQRYKCRCIKCKEVKKEDNAKRKVMEL